MHPKYSGCTAFGFVNAEVKTGTATEGCNYTLHAPGTEEAEMKFAGALKLTCTTGQEIAIEAGTCLVTIAGPQTLTGVTLQNTTVSPMDFMWNASVSGVAATAAQSGFLCPLIVGTATGSYTGGTTERAYNNNGIQVDTTAR